MNILLMSQFYPPTIGGEERHVRNLAIALRDRGHEVSVATQGERDSSEVQDGIPVVRMRPVTASLPFTLADPSRPNHPPIADPGIVRRLRRVLEQGAFDIVHAHNWIVGSLVALRRRTDAAMVLTLHDYSHVCTTKRLMHLDREPCSGPAPRKCLRCTSVHYKPGIGPLLYGMNALALRQENRALDRILAVSNAVARGNGLDRQPVPFEVIPNFIPDDLGEGLPTRSDWLPQGSYLLYAGDLSHDKGVLVLLQAYRLLTAPRPPLLLIGRTMATTPDASALPEGVQLIGPRPHEDVLSAMAHAALVVVPSISADACPTVVLEAMAFGTPVVTTATGGMVDMVTNGKEGLLVQPGDGVALAGALEAMLGSAEARLTAGKAARLRADAFRAGPVVDRIERSYRLALRDRELGPGARTMPSVSERGDGG